MRIIVHTAGGLQPIRPQPGDPPETTVRIDNVPPIAELSNLEQGEGYFADHLIVSWQPGDSQAEGETASLSYSSHSNGPWVTAAANLKHNGRYAWRLSRSLPAQFYLRLEVSDRAGNVATDQTGVPVRVKLPTPTGRLGVAQPAGS